MPDPTVLLRVISGEPVFGLDVDTRIRQAANCMSARLMIEWFLRCDDTVEGWAERFAGSLTELASGDPGSLIGFDDGRWQGKEVEDESELSSIPEAICTFYLKLEFRNEDAAYYQFPLFPAMDEPFLAGGARKRELQFQHLRVDLAHPDDLQLFIEGLRSNPHLIAVEESSETAFWEAPSHAV